MPFIILVEAESYQSLHHKVNERSVEMNALTWHALAIE
jgi:hypothetical protein